jgi:spore germination cell wall hydrolase CwlJ-like protein
MTLLTRVASFAAMSLSLAGLLGTSTPSIAADLGSASIVRQAISAPVLGLVNTPTITSVPGPKIEIAAADPDESFDSLDEAVAAQDAAVVDDSVRCLAGAVYFESKGEPLSGQLAVAQVVINRAKSGRFPPDVCGVVTQRGQFSFVRGGRIPSIDEARSAYRTAIAVARVALARAWDGAAQNALYFNTANRSPGARLQRIAAIGNHIFYR